MARRIYGMGDRIGPPVFRNPVHPRLESAPGFRTLLFTVLNYSQGHTVWQYADQALKLRAMMRPGFLNPHSGEIATGDAVLAIAEDRTVWLRAKRTEISGVVLTWAR